VVSIDGGFGARAYPRVPEMPLPKAR